jgi:hypothetical protein
MEHGLKNIDDCLVRDERKVRIYKEYFLNANPFILSIHDLAKTDLNDLDALNNRYLKLWLGMPKSGFFLPIHSKLGIDVKSVSHLYKDNRSLDIVRALEQGFRLQCEPRFRVSRSGPENLPSLFVRLRLQGPFCHLRNLRSVLLLLLSPPWPSMTLNHKIPSHLRALYMHDLGILTFHWHCTLIQLWNQTHAAG